MADKQEIEIIISPDGEVKLEVKGIKGPACLPQLKQVADQIGKTKSQNFTAEYYEKPSSKSKTQNF